MSRSKDLDEQVELWAVLKLTSAPNKEKNHACQILEMREHRMMIPFVVIKQVLVLGLRGKGVDEHA